VEHERKGSGTEVQDPDAHATRSDAAESTVSIWKISPNAGPAVPRIGDEDSVVDFEDAFKGVVDLEVGESIVIQGEPIPDPLEQLTPGEQAKYRDELEDVIKAQRYGQSFGSVSRR